MAQLSYSSCVIEPNKVLISPQLIPTQMIPVAANFKDFLLSVLENVHNQLSRVGA